MKESLWLVIILIIVVLIALNCAPGNYRWNPNVEGSKPANFWAGLWHGIIIIITFVVSLFTNTVKIYEVNNVGWAYNLGYILGVLISIGGGFRYTKTRKVKKYDWNEIEEKIREGIKTWLDESKDEVKKKEWEEIGKKVEEKIKRKLKEWAEKE
ncbi:MAG: hypothetical protein N2201_06370 [candidate division WOR-3 bacterium]|nr:hypothetical protein [candidate division WOR-3 bacterium]